VPQQVQYRRLGKSDEDQRCGHRGERSSCWQWRKIRDIDKNMDTLQVIFVEPAA